MSTEVESFTDGHQRQIESTLSEMFGSPSSPRWTIAEEPAEEDSAEDADEDAADSEKVKWIDSLDRAHLAHGASVYNLRCAGCHGLTGDGQGEAARYLHPKPRDYRRGIFKFTSTPYGLKPSRADLVRTIRRGAKGTSMPAFPWMSKEDLNAVIDYVILLSQRGEVETIVAQIVKSDYDEGDEIDSFEFIDALSQVRDDWAGASDQIVQPRTPEPPNDEESVLLGRQVFMSGSCWKCHGKDGKGQTQWLSEEFRERQESLPEDQKVKINVDEWGEPAPAADITARMLHGGRRPIDVYRRIYTGINGTPMPAFDQTFTEDPDKVWHLVHYVLSIVEGGPVDPEASTEDATEEEE